MAGVEHATNPKDEVICLSSPPARNLAARVCPRPKSAHCLGPTATRGEGRVLHVGGTRGSTLLVRVEDVVLRLHGHMRKRRARNWCACATRRANKSGSRVSG